MVMRSCIFFLFSLLSFFSCVCVCMCLREAEIFNQFWLPFAFLFGERKKQSTPSPPPPPPNGIYISLEFYSVFVKFWGRGGKRGIQKG